MGLPLENEAECLSHQHKRRRHSPVIRCQRRDGAPYRASGSVPSTIADVREICGLRQQCAHNIPGSVGRTRTRMDY